MRYTSIQQAQRQHNLSLAGSKQSYVPQKIDFYTEMYFGFKVRDESSLHCTYMLYVSPKKLSLELLSLHILSIKWRVNLHD